MLTLSKREKVVGAKGPKQQEVTDQEKGDRRDQERMQCPVHVTCPCHPLGNTTEVRKCLMQLDFLQKMMKTLRFASWADTGETSRACEK
jgi:hypothetical protein